MPEYQLAQLKTGDYGMIQSVHVEPDFKRRLYDLGFSPDEMICCKYIAPTGSPMAFLVKETLLSLRTKDCRNIIISTDEKL